jgi:hypothetical protein
MATNKSRIPEEILYEIWEQREFTDTINTSEGAAIEILNPGQRNIDLAGPDFHNARIRIGNLTFNGDVEIDNYHSDWRTHGHHLNKRYNKLILHVTLSEETHQNYVVTQSGRKVNSIALENYLNEPIRKKIFDHLSSIKTEDKLRMPCIGLNSDVPLKIKLDFINELGLLRHRKKCERYINRLKELIIFSKNQFKEPVVKYNFEKEIENRHFEISEFEDKLIWQQLFYEQIYEALGYSKNKNIMHRLSNAADIRFLNSLNDEEKNVSVLESILFNISGIIPDVNKIPDEETSEYVRNLVENWVNIRPRYDGESFSISDWNFFKLRPQNFPTVRIASGARLLNVILQKNLVSRLIKVFEENNDQNKLITRLRNLLIIKADGYWATHYNFNKPVKAKIKYFLGLGRADEIIVNLILPFMSVYFDLFGNRTAAERVLALYLNFKQKEGNKLISDVSEVLLIKNQKLQSIFYQGMIELFRNYCIKQRCLECNIGKEVFN